MAEEDIATLAERARLDGRRARGNLPAVPSGWSAMVRRVQPIGHTYEVWFISIIDPTGGARYTKTASRLVDAMVIAERQVRGRNALPD